MARKKAEPPSGGLNEFLSRVVKSRGGNSLVQYSSEDSRLKIPYWLSTGAPSLDAALGGGIPGSRIVEIFSNRESEGKTSLAVTIVREAQKIGGVGIYMDTEGTLLPEYFEGFGLDLDRCLFSFPETLEDAFENIQSQALEFRQCFPMEIPLVIVVDSVAAGMTAAEESGGYGDHTVAAQARVMSKGLKKLRPVLTRTGATLILLNQSRTKIGIKFGDPNETPGGRAMKFYATQRIALRRAKKLVQGTDKEAYGIQIEAHAVKSKTAPPFQKILIDLHFGRGIDWYGSAFDLLLDSEIIVKTARPGYYKIGEDSVTRKTFPDYVSEHSDLLNSVSSLVAGNRLNTVEETSDAQ